MKYREVRRPVYREISLRTDEGTVSAELRDISPSGMKLLGISLPIGTSVFVPILGEDLAADVVFVDDSSVGLKFGRSLTKTQIAAFISPGAAKGLGQVQRFREL